MENKLTKNDMTKAKNLLTKFIRIILQEKIAIEDLDTAEKRVVTKAEAVARIICRGALGYTEITESGKRIIHQPDKTFIHLIYDRVEGRVGTADETGKRERKIPDRISDVAKARANKYVKKEEKENL